MYEGGEGTCAGDLGRGYAAGVKLIHTVTGEVRPLLARSLVGRSRSCNVRLSATAVSGEHALVIWGGTSWEIRDLGSTNGTFVDGQRLEPGKPVTLGPRAKLGFGEPEAPWSVTSDAAPGLMAVDLASGEVLLAEGRILALPDEAQPALVIYEAADGTWVSEDTESSAIKPVDDQAILTVGGRVLRLELPVAHEGTPLAEDDAALERVTLRFAVSKDEETVRIWVVYRGRARALDPREHGYLLLTLARRRLQDADKPMPERGWIERDQLVRMLRVDNNGLNVAIYRARQQLAAAGVLGAAGIVEVRRGQRRIGTDRIQLELTGE